jgi:hypothetical protein
MRTPRNRYSVGSVVRCYRTGEAGRVGIIRDATGNVPGRWRYQVEWIDGKTPSGYPTTTTVGLTNIVGLAEWDDVDDDEPDKAKGIQSGPYGDGYRGFNWS